MTSLREYLKFAAEKFFSWVWRLAILALPWQTRVFQEGPTIAGSPWEEGRISLYGSEILMLVTIVTAMFLFAQEKQAGEPWLKWRDRWGVKVLSLCVVVGTFLTTASLRSTAEWWIEVSILVTFFWVLVKRVSLRDLSSWVVLSLIPHVVLGISQAISQHVSGSSLLGIAVQNPQVPGVSVIEVGKTRWLRSYGGFPHPNLFGGWLVLGMALVYQSLQETLYSRKQKIFSFLYLLLFSCALVLSYSRSAWVALALLWIIALGRLLFQKSPAHKKTLMIALGVVLVGILGTVCIRPGLVFSRTQAETRLEQKSLVEREEGINNALRILRTHPLFGAGLGANGWVLSRLNAEEGVPAVIPIPPHTVPVLAVAELGIVGSFLFLWIVGRYFSPKRVLFGLVPFAPLLVFDHYLWSYWGGKGACVLIVLFFCTKRASSRVE